MRRVVLMGMLSLLAGLFSSTSRAAKLEVAETYSNLRSMVFKATPTQLGLNIAPTEVWAVLMETGYPDAVVTLLSIADGTVSIYFSKGGGIIGLGQHEGPKRAAESFRKLAQQFAGKAVRTREYPLPAPSLTRFYMLTGDGAYMMEAKEEDLGEGRHSFAPLFLKGHELITEIRHVDEPRRAEQGAPADRLASPSLRQDGG